MLEMDRANEPEVRTVTANGRWHLDDYAYRFCTDDGFRLERVQAERPETLADRVLRFVDEHPGLSTRATVQGGSGRNEDIQRELEQLASLGGLRKEKTAKGYAWYRPEQHSLDLEGEE
jgi:hypothetical protein